MERRFSDAYRMVAICFGIQALGVGTYISFGVFFNPLIEEFGWSRAAVAGASSTAFFCAGLFGIVVGRLNDRFGPRRILPVTALLMGLGCVLTARLSRLWELYFFFGIIFGMGLSAIDVIALTTVTRWFSERRGFMTGIVKVGTGAGQFVIPLTAGALILGYGWRWAIALIGIGVAAVLMLMARYLRRDPGELRRDGGQEGKPSGGRPPVAVPEADLGLPWSRAVRTVQLWTICLVNLFLVFCLMIILLHIVPYARDAGIPPLRAAGVLSTIGAVSMLGRFASGLIIDRGGAKIVMHLAFMLLLADLVWLQFARELWALYLFAAFYGLAHGSFFTAISPLVAEWFGIRAHGALFGLVVFFGTLGGASGPLVAGHLFDVLGSYRLTFQMVIAMALVAWALLLSLRPVESPSPFSRRGKGDRPAPG
jgi:MFS family permease